MSILFFNIMGVGSLPSSVRGSVSSLSRKVSKRGVGALAGVQGPWQGCRGLEMFY